MLRKTLIDWLTVAAEAQRGETRVARRGDMARPVSAHRERTLDGAVIEQLVDEALTSGLLTAEGGISDEPLTGGNTAERVGVLSLRLPFVFKMDSNGAKLAAEGATIRAIRTDPNLPRAFREAWPIIFALRSEPPYAYLMEYFPRDAGWISLEDRLYPGPDGAAPDRLAVLRLMTRVLDLLFEGYRASVDRRSLPNVAMDYVDRISGRLAEAAKQDARFRPRPLRIGGRELAPWTDYLERLERRRDRILAVTPAFRTVVHGDPNPGNLLLRTDGGGAVKLIDPKEWGAGDYLFDIAKITHFLEGTGPIEKPASGKPPRPQLREEGRVGIVDYEIERPSWTDDAVAVCLEHVREFAEAQGDRAWRARYALAMASNLLGLPIGRLTHKKNPRPEAAFILYCEGLKRLAEACELVEA